MKEERPASPFHFFRIIYSFSIVLIHSTSFLRSSGFTPKHKKKGRVFVRHKNTNKNQKTLSSDKEKSEFEKFRQYASPDTGKRRQGTTCLRWRRSNSLKFQVSVRRSRVSSFKLQVSSFKWSWISPLTIRANLAFASMRMFSKSILAWKLYFE